MGRHMFGGPVRERGVTFQEENIVALMEGRKTQTRRLIVGGADPAIKRIFWAEKLDMVPQGRYTGWVRECTAPFLLPILSPYGGVGDRIYAKETWRRCADVYTYRATEPKAHTRWHSPRFMPRRASRILLTITELEAERLQDITVEDALAEGISLPVNASPVGWNPRTSYQQLWDKINGAKAPWACNPWVWKLEFTILEMKKESRA